MAGFGTIGIIDFDKVEVSNLHRQPIYLYSDVGDKKVKVAKNYAYRQNSSIIVNSYCLKLDSTNALDILKNYDIIIDGTDNSIACYDIDDACNNLSKPLVFGAVYGFEGRVSVFSYKRGPCYRDVFPVPEKEETCAEHGILGIVPGIIGLLQANEAIKIALNIGNVLSGKMWILNTMSMKNYVLNIPRT